MARVEVLVHVDRCPVRRLERDAGDPTCGELLLEGDALLAVRLVEDGRRVQDVHVDQPAD